MAYVPRGAPKGKKSRERFYKIAANIVDAVEDFFIVLSAGNGFEVESDAGATLMEIDNDTGVVGISKLVVGSQAELPYGTGADILIATLTAAFGAPAAGRNGEVMVYRDTTGNKSYLVTIADGAFYLEELTAALAA